MFVKGKPNLFMRGKDMMFVIAAKLVKGFDDAEIIEDIKVLIDDKQAVVVANHRYAELDAQGFKCFRVKNHPLPERVKNPATKKYAKMNTVNIIRDDKPKPNQAAGATVDVSSAPPEAQHEEVSVQTVQIPVADLAKLYEQQERILTQLALVAERMNMDLFKR